jgi:hypothetical protein
MVQECNSGLLCIQEIKEKVIRVGEKFYYGESKENWQGSLDSYGYRGLTRASEKKRREIISICGHNYRSNKLLNVVTKIKDTHQFQ